MLPPISSPPSSHTLQSNSSRFSSTAGHLPSPLQPPRFSPHMELTNSSCKLTLLQLTTTTTTIHLSPPPSRDLPIPLCYLRSSSASKPIHSFTEIQSQFTTKSMAAITIPPRQPNSIMSQSSNSSSSTCLFNSNSSNNQSYSFYLILFVFVLQETHCSSLQFQKPRPCLHELADESNPFPLPVGDPRTQHLLCPEIHRREPTNPVAATAASSTSAARSLFFSAQIDVGVLCSIPHITTDAAHSTVKPKLLP